MIITDQKVFDWLEANADKYGLHGYFARGTGGVSKDVLLKLMQALDAQPSAERKSPAGTVMEALKRLLSHYDSVARDLDMDPDTQPVVIDTKAILAAALLPPQPSAALPGKDVGATDFAWLVESFGGSIKHYLSGFDEVYAGNGFAWHPAWTTEHAKALRFSRQADAAGVAAVLPSPSKAKAIEHGWSK